MNLLTIEFASNIDTNPKDLNYELHNVEFKNQITFIICTFVSDFKYIASKDSQAIIF